MDEAMNMVAKLMALAARTAPKATAKGFCWHRSHFG
jgi:uncharacterized ferredoxin-like protein